MNRLQVEIEPKQLARRARLRYVTDGEAGYARQRNGHGFVYLNSRGGRLRDQRKIVRIDQLAIPPAWRDVWICRSTSGHLQATGRDDRDRKQYLYHERWSETTNLDKFRRLALFGRLLPRLRRAVFSDLRGKSLSRDRVLAGMVAVLDVTSIRAGNEEYVKENNSYGLATLCSRHVKFSGTRAKLRFKGKGGLEREASIEDKRLVSLIKQCHQLKGTPLFQFVDDEGKTCDVTAADVNQYLQKRMRQPFTAKDFRTWKASSRVASILFENRDIESATERKKIVGGALAEAAELLGNTVTICRKYYVHPGMLESYESGDFSSLFTRVIPRPRNKLARDETILIHFLKRRP